MSTPLKLGRPSPRTMVVAVVVALIAVVAVVVVAGSGKKHGVAYFESVKSVYPHDKIRILGVEVGTIDDIVPEDDRVRVEFSYDSKYTLPADVRAAIVSPTLVATRFIQLDPAYADGPRFPDGGTIPAERTVSPLEFDDLKSELSRVAKALGPDGLDRTGALSDFLDVAAQNGNGQGKRFNVMIRELSGALETLSEGRGDLFGTVRNLQVFVSAVAAMDTQVAEFNRRLGGVSDVLADNGDELTAALKSVDKAARLVRTFVRDNRPGMSEATHQLAGLTTTLAGSRDDLATLLHVAPNTLTNFFNIFSPRMSAFTGGLMVDNLATPGHLVCALIANQVGDPAAGEKACNSYLGPLMNQLRVQAPPIGTGGPLIMPGGGGPPREYDGGEPEDESRPSDGGQSELPPSLDDGGLAGLLIPGGAR